MSNLPGQWPNGVSDPINSKIVIIDSIPDIVALVVTAWRPCSSLGGRWEVPGGSLRVLGSSGADRRRPWGSMFSPATTLSCIPRKHFPCDLPRGSGTH